MRAGFALRGDQARQATAPPPAGDLLLRALRMEDSDLAGWIEAVDGGWDALLGEAQRHAVAPLLYSRCTTLPYDAAPPASWLESLQGIYLHSALRNAALFDELTQLLGALQELDIPIMALKGTHLASQIYPDVALRPMADIDLLGREENILRIHRLMLELGYSQSSGSVGRGPGPAHHHLPTFTKPDAIPVEVHRTLAPLDSPFRLEAGALWERSRLAEIGGVRVQVLAPDDLILHLCTHAAYNHRFEIPLLFLCDIAATLRRYSGEVDWRRLVTTANTDGRSAWVYSALRLVATTLAVELPRNELDRLRHDQSDVEVVEVARGYLLGPRLDLPATFQRVADGRGIPARVREIAAAAFPPPARLGEIYGLKPGSIRVYIYYLIRPIDLLVRRGRITWGLMLGSAWLQPALLREKRRRVIQRWAAAKSAGGGA